MRCKTNSKYEKTLAVLVRGVIKKSGKPNIAPLQPPTLATFRSWGSSAGAGRADLPVQN